MSYLSHIKFYSYNKFSIRLKLAALLFLATPPVYADLIMTAPPRESQQQGEAIYGPIAKFLSRHLNQKVVYSQPSSWGAYALDMRNDKYDIIFDGPQFVAWRMKHLQHTPVVRLPGELRFMLITSTEHKAVKNIRDSVKLVTCGLASPNLGMLDFLAQFNNLTVFPPIVEIKGGMPEVYKSFKAGKCQAMLLRDAFYKGRISAEEKAKLKIVYTSIPLPNQTVSVSRRVNRKMQSIIRSSLLTASGALSAEKLLNRYSKKQAHFVTSEADTFAGAENLLEGSVWGW